MRILHILRTILTDLKSILHAPICDEWLDAGLPLKAATMMREDPEGFARIAKEWTYKFAQCRSAESIIDSLSQTQLEWPQEVLRIVASLARGFYGMEDMTFESLINSELTL